MRFLYLGTGAAEGIPALFCNCEFCTAVRRLGGKGVRSRSQLLIDGELSVDFSPDAFYHAAVLGADLSAVKYLLVTHSHMDHFYAHDFILRGYKYAHDMTSPTLDLYGNREITEVFGECTRRELRPDVCSSIKLHEVRAFEPVGFGDWRVHALRARHTSQDPLVYLIERGAKRYLHLCDTGPLPDCDFEYLEKLGGGSIDLITFDCTFLFGRADERARHMGLYDDAKVLARLEQAGLADSRTKKVITHFSHNSAPTAENLKRAEEEYGFIAAYDGMELEI